MSTADFWRPPFRFTLDIDLGNAAFDEWPAVEVARILREVADSLDNGVYDRRILDVNGNAVGAYALEVAR